MGENKQFLLAARPEGEIKDSDFQLVTESVPEPGDGQFVVEITHISVDPAMRGWMSAARSYMPPVELGDVMRALAVGRVTASNHPGFEGGDWVHGAFGVQEYALSDGRGAYKIQITDRLTPAAYLGVLGLTGLTAYFGLLDVGRLSEEDTVLVSGGAGGVGRDHRLERDHRPRRRELPLPAHASMTPASSPFRFRARHSCFGLPQTQSRSDLGLFVPVTLLVVRASGSGER